jgi:hypothetical protein
MSIKICPKCNDSHIKSGIFCSRACANSRGPRSEKFKQKVSRKLSGIPSHKKGKEISERILVGCFICDTPVKVKKIHSHKKTTCKSAECIHKANVIAGKASASKRVLRSKDEIKLFELCRSHFNNVRSNYIIEDGWDADIVIYDLKIAILWNGPWHYKEMNMSNHSLSQVQTRDKIKKKLFESSGWTVVIFEDRYYTPSSAFEQLVGDVRPALT